MKQETNNEMDMLLRRLGRRQDTAAPDNHLDADELSSYAENVLPPAARSRYTEHLAECARCRDLVVQLSSSAGVVVAQETAKVSAPSALSKFLASLFSPMVLRYAVPALGLVVIAAIALTVSRQQQPRPASVAQLREAERAQAPVPESQPEPSSSLEGESRDRANTKTSPSKAVVQGDSDSETSAAPPPPNAPPTVGAVTANVQEDTATKKAEQQQEEAKEAPPPKPTPATADLQKLQAVARQERTENRAAAANEPPAEKAKEQDRGAGVAAAPDSASRRAAPFGVATPSSGRLMRDDAAEKDKNDAETRTVAGRRFRKKGNVWIDTAYSSQNVTSLSRGSEQYRALVADEPAIKEIAGQLDGDIIVVWKGRAYRIQ